MKKLKKARVTRVSAYKEEIAGHFNAFLEGTGHDQVWLAKKLKTQTSILSKIVCFKLEAFTVDRLLRYLEIIRPDLYPALKKSSKAKKSKRKNP